MGPPGVIGQRDRPHRPDLLRLSLAAFIVLTVSTVHAYVPPLRAIRPGLLIWAFVVAGVFLAPHTVRWGNLTRSWPPRAVLAIAALAAFSIPFGLSLGQAGLYYLNVFARVVLFFVLLVASVRGWEDLRLFVRTFVVSGALLAFLALTVLPFVSTFGGQRLASGVMYDPNDLGMVFLTVIPMGLVAVETARGWLRWLLIATLPLMGAAVAITGSRGAFLGGILLAPVLLVMMNHISLVRRTGAVALLGIGLLVAAPEGYWDRMATIFEPTEDYNYSDYYGRVQIAKRGVGYMLQYPITGVGISNFGRAEGTLTQTLDTGIGVRWIAPHNTYVQVGAELGIPALACWLALLLGGTIGVWRLWRRLPGYWRHGTAEQRFLYAMGRYLPASFLAFAVTSYFTSHAYTPPFYILVAFLTAFLGLVTRKRLARRSVVREGTAPDAQGARRRLGPGFLHGLPGASGAEVRKAPDPGWTQDPRVLWRPRNDPQ